MALISRSGYAEGATSTRGDQELRGNADRLATIAHDGY